MLPYSKKQWPIAFVITRIDRVCNSLYTNIYGICDGIENPDSEIMVVDWDTRIVQVQKVAAKAGYIEEGQYLILDFDFLDNTMASSPSRVKISIID